MSEAAAETSLKAPKPDEPNQTERPTDRLAEARAKQLMDYTPFNLARKAER
jgi:hypothetical protein